MNDPIYATAEGLRLLLLDLAYARPGAWATAPDAAELMACTMDKYDALARKYGLELFEREPRSAARSSRAGVRVCDENRHCMKGAWGVCIVDHQVQRRRRRNALR